MTNTLMQTGFTACADGCCRVIRDRELRPHPDTPFPITVRPMFQVLDDDAGPGWAIGVDGSAWAWRANPTFDRDYWANYVEMVEEKFIAALRAEIEREERNA